MPRETTMTVPASALRFRAGETQLAQVVGESAEREVEIQARSGEPIDHWWWGRIVHDFDGMQHKPSIPLDYCHDPDQIIGVGDQFEVADGNLIVRGKLTPFTDEDRASEVIHKADAGVPYEASIDFFGEMRLEWIPEDASTEVNGQTFDGPGYVVREWQLRGVAICPHGYDANTESRLSADGAEKTITLFSQGEELPMPKQKSKPTNQQLSSGAAVADPPEEATAEEAAGEVLPPGDDTPVEDSAAETDQAESDQPEESTSGAAGEESAELSADDPRQQLRRYVARFGAENGAAWFAEDVSYEQALERHADAQQQRIEQLTRERDEARARLSALDLGEEDPVSGGTEAAQSEQEQQLTSRIGEGLARFAAGIKLPGTPSAN